MFTIKYRSEFGVESISGGYTDISFEMVAGAPTVVAWRDGLTTTWSPSAFAATTGDPWTHTRKLWVMNQQGATVAAYEL